MAIRYGCGVALCTLTVFSLVAMAAEPAAGSGTKWGPHVDVEGKAGSKRSIGEADLFMPIRQDANTLLFTDLRGRFDSQSGNEGNFGVGMRHMQDNGWNLGSYGYWDHRRSGTGNTFEQLTLGAEALGRDWDFRVNGYLPQGTRVKSLSPISSAAVSGAAVQVSTAMREERALGGYDAEAGWRVPLFDVESDRQLRFYAGGYHFSDSVLNVTGPRVRAEYSMDAVQGLWKGAQLQVGAEAQRDGVRGGQTFLGVRLRIPFGASYNHAQHLSVQERRMTAPIVRDVDIVSQSRVVSTLVETATTTGGQAITVLDSTTTTGAALPGAVTGLANGSTILLSGTFNTTATVDLTGNKSLIAGSITVRTPSGYTAVVNVPATISNSNNANTVIIQAPGNNTISGLTISGTRAGGAGYGIQVNNTAGNVSILNNTVTMTQTGANGIVGIGANQQNLNLTIRGNTVTVIGMAGQTATGLGVLGSTGPASATISGNTLDVSGGGNNYAVRVDAQTTVNAGSTSNVLVRGTCNGTPASGSVGFTNGTTCP